jgi:Undecaprenyl-phosphate galactose phosphotransferase WbaP
MITAVTQTAYETPKVLSFAHCRWLTVLSIVGADCLAISASVAISTILTGFAAPIAFQFSLLLSSLFVLLAIFSFNGLYPGIPDNPIVEFKKVLHACGISSIILISACLAASENLHTVRLSLTLIWIISFVLVPLARLAVRRVGSHFSWWGLPTVILGNHETGQKILKTLQQQPSLGLRPVVIIDISQSGHRNSSETVLHSDVGALPSSKKMPGRVSSCYAIVALPHLNGEELCEALSDHADKYNHVMIVPNLLGVSSLFVAPRDINGILGLEIHQGLTQFLPQAIKRSCDIAISLVMGIALSPVILFVYLAIRLSSPGPAFYGQRRIGRNNEEFIAWKFRSMIMNADAVLKKHLEDDPCLRAEWEKDHKLKRDPRVTTIGRIIRKTSLDELPQLWNVLCGQMSLVGPRPIVSAEVHKYGKRFNHYRRVRPGITGLWQTSGRNNTTYEARTWMDEYYVRNWSVSLDFYILFRTVKTVLFTEGAY